MKSVVLTDRKRSLAVFPRTHIYINSGTVGIH
jgi:hypothetical protein